MATGDIDIDYVNNSGAAPADNIAAFFEPEPNALVNSGVIFNTNNGGNSATVSNTPNSGFFDAVGQLFSNKNVDTLTKAGLTYVQLKNGGTSKPAGSAPVYVGYPNPAPNENPLGKIFSKLAQPNSSDPTTSGQEQTGAFGGNAVTVLGIIAIAVVALFLFKR